ncbi:MAG: hypothetical protein JW900_04925 [Anaerolineae bacterium]|nr:hypothetical protein [Anaerolineae bacterium]
MDNTVEQLPLALRSYWTPITILTTAFLLFTLGLSGLRVHEAVAARDPNTPLLAVALASGIEGAAGLAAYRVLQLRRREQPLPRYLVSGLLFFVLLAAAVHLDHALRYAHPAFTNPVWLAWIWELVLNLLLALAYPSGLLLVGEVLPEHLRTIDAENAARRQRHEEEKAAAQERERALWSAQRTTAAPPAEASPQLAATPEPPSDECVRGWLEIWDRAGAQAFDLELVQQVFPATAHPYLTDAVRQGLLRQDGRGRYEFTVPARSGIAPLLAPPRA